MPLLESAIKIDAPIERVFNAVIDPTSIAKFAPVHAVSNIKGNIGEKGNSADYEYHVMGIKLKQTMTVLEVDEPFTVIYEMSGAFPGKWMYTLESHEGGTVVRVKVDYSTGTGMISKIANLLFVNETNEKNLEIGQLGLKRFCEY
jgi:uncharacterized protein YndB with AHSA1/START domain